MKKIGRRICLLLVLLFLSTARCQAQQAGALILTSKTETVEVGQEMDIGITLQEAKTVAYETTLYWDTTKLELLSQEENTNVEAGRILALWYDSTGGTTPKTGDLVRFRFRAKEAGNVNFMLEGKWYDEAGNENNQSSMEKKIQITEVRMADPEEENTQREDNTNLENLAIEDVLVYPPFEAIETSYTAEVGNKVENVKILAIPEQESASVEIEGTEGLQEGYNDIRIQVTAPSGAKKEYMVRIYKRNAEEEIQYEEEQAQMVEQVKQAYEIEKLSTIQAVTEQEEKVEEETIKSWYGVLVLMVGIILGVIWYILEMKKKEKFSKKT